MSIGQNQNLRPSFLSKHSLLHKQRLPHKHVWEIDIGRKVLQNIEEMTGDPFYQEFGELLKAARQLHRPLITQGKLAEALGISRPSIANIEKGRQPVQLHLVVKMAEILGVEVGSLIPQQLPPLASKEQSLAVEELKRQGASPGVIRKALLHLPPEVE
jgi:transcriptional regulator with XRE-family HTH domain